MKYLLMIYSAEESGPQPGSEEFLSMIEDYQNLTKQMSKDEVLISGNPLESVNTATTVRLRNNKLAITDGPFAETKEALGGYFLIDCKNLDEAINYAKQIPTASYGSIEIRPIQAIH